MDKYLPSIIAALVPLFVVAASYGGLNARVLALEKTSETLVSRAEFVMLSASIQDLRSEIRDLREDLRRRK